jgi:hypothetical protein
LPGVPARCSQPTIGYLSLYQCRNR